MIHIIPKPTDTPDDNSTGMVMKALRRAGKDYQVLNIERIDPFSSGLEHELVWACGITQDEHQFEVLNALSLSNRIVNTPSSIFTCASKVMTSALLLRDGIHTPDTSFSASYDEASKFIEKYGKVVSKPVYGFDGNGIYLLQSPEELGPPPYYLQEYVPNDRDYRVFVIDGVAVGAIERVSDTLAHNIHQGGCGRPRDIDPEMQEIAGAAARATGVDYGGVDLLDSPEGYCVLEVNGTPNWHCMAAPIPELLADYLIRVEKDMRK